MIWDELQCDNDNPHYPYFVTVPTARLAASPPQSERTAKIKSTTTGFSPTGCQAACGRHRSR
jgi:hypothetical protein